MSLGLVVLEKKLFTRTPTPTPQSDDIKKQNGRVYTIYLNVLKCVQIVCRILIFKGLNSQFKIAATTQYITQMKDLTKNRMSLGLVV